MDKPSTDTPNSAMQAADFDATLREAGALHRSGKLSEAELHYRALLAQRPQHGALLHVAGLCALQQGQAPLALERLAQALEQTSADPALHANYGLALQATGRHESALAAYRQALALDPLQPDALFNLGGVLMQLHQPGAALEAYERVLAEHPRHLPTLLRRSAVLHALGRRNDALVSYDRAMAATNASPAHIPADPRLQAALSAGRANVLSDLGRAEQALAGYDQALALKPDFAEAWSNRSGVLADLSRFVEALGSAMHALALQPDHAQAALHRVRALREMGQGVAALQICDALLARRRDHEDGDGEAAVWFHRGLTLMTLARYRDARDSYAAALALTPGDADLRWNTALCDLLLGDYVAGWRGYEARWDSTRLKVPRRPFARPLWLGDADLRGKRLLLHAEQGLGDTLQFCRYVPLLADRGGTIVLEVQPALRRLLGMLPGVTQVLAQGEVPPAFDLHCPIPSLPLACADTHPLPPAQVPYLRADPALCASWGARLEAIEAGAALETYQAARNGLPDAANRPLRIGVAWRSSGSQARYLRGLPLAHLASLLTLPAHFIGLQVDRPAGEAELPNLTRFDSQLSDFAETAALVAQLDLVLSIDTAVAHLAGALGRPVWVLLPFHADWRWMTARSDSPWYPDARLFRQAAPGQWAGVIDAVRGALEIEWLAERHTATPLPGQAESHRKLN